MMNIPALVGVPADLNGIRPGSRVIVDGMRGEVIFDPDEAECRLAQERLEKEEEKLRLLQELKGREENITRSGKKNQSVRQHRRPGDVGYALENDAEGIGLFRSEFLYLGRNDFPSEEEQFQAYRQVLQTMGEKKVIVRTLDIGADKQADYLIWGRRRILLWGTGLSGSA